MSETEEKKIFHASHAPEPWHLSHSGYANTPFVIFSGDRRPNWASRFPFTGVHVIADVFHDESPEHKEQIANAELLKAAPRMLRVLSTTCHKMHDHYHGTAVPFEECRVSDCADARELLADLKKAGVF